MESSDDAVILGKTLRGDILSWNRGAEALYGYTSEEVLGKSIALIIPSNRQEELSDILERLGRGETIPRFETTRLRKDGTLVDISLALFPICNAQGRIIGATSIAHDMTEQKRMMAELRAANAALQEANRARSQFLATMSHEMRTPLTSIIGFSQLLLEDVPPGDGNPQQRATLERILNNGHQLLTLINGVLDLEQIEEGHIVITCSRVEVREVLTWVVEQAQPLALSREVVVRTELEEGVGYLKTSLVKLRQILLDMVSNALKFTEQGEVTVSAARVDTDHLALVVQDSGVGTPVEMQGRIFEAFYQVDGAYTRKIGGTGLGLSIVRQMTTLLGGTIKLNSAPGQGSTFTVILPIKAVQQPLEPGLPRLHAGQQPEASTISSASAERTPDVLDELLAGSAHPEATAQQSNLVLAVDDNPDILLLIKAGLQDTSYTVVEVREPKQVMDLVQEMHPQAIILDVIMPDLNGWQLLHQLKSNPATAAIPVVMLTVLTEPATGYVLGADDYLIKPFKSEVLLKTLERLITKPRQ